MTPWLWILIGIFLLFLCIGGYIFFTACRRKKEYNWLNSESLKNTPYEKHIDLIAHSSKWLKEQKAQDVFITSDDGLRLHGLFVPAEHPRGTVLLTHGYRSTMLVDFGMVLDFYHKLGMNLLLPEQRAHGQSEGKYITFGVKEAKDMFCWLTFHNEKISQCSVILSGLSMGSSTVMYMLDETLPSNVKAVICDCGFTSPAEIIGKIFRETTHIPAGVFIFFADLFARVFGRFSLYGKNSCKTLKKNKLPILMAHGKADNFVPCEMTQKAFACCTGEKYLILAEGASHGYSFFCAREEYEKIVKKLINDYCTE